MRRRSGFTLTEIMITIAVIGVIMIMALPSIRKARTVAHQKEAEARIELLAAAIKQLAWDTGKWPRALPRNSTQDPETWDLSTADAGLVATDGDFPNWQGPYIDKVPLDPWGSPYFFDPDYRVEGVNRVAVGSFGPNKSGRNVYDSDNIYVILDD
jgi:general secretion pathway protein G